jgi:DNA-binding LacI/PurR family transcriptional regulator
MKLTPKAIHPLYDQVKALLRKQIEEGTLAANSALPAQDELAKTLGVSDMTVRRALIELTSEGWLQRIRGKGTFVRERPAATDGVAADSARANTCIAIIANFDATEMKSSLFYHRIFQSMLQAADASGAFLTIKKVTQPQGEFVARLKSQALAGLVVLGVTDEDLLKRIQHLPIPAVVLDSAQPSSGPMLDEVNHADEEAAYQAVTELAQHGHERIGIYGPSRPALFFKQRLDGYRRALKVAGIKSETRLIYNVVLNSQSAYAQTVKLLQEPDRCTALFCTIDELAIGAIAAVRDSGLSVPEDLSIAGFGDIGLFSAPALSTARLPMEEMGAAAIETLMRRVQQPGLKPQRHIITTEWIARGSIGFPNRKAVSAG